MCELVDNYAFYLYFLFLLLVHLSSCLLLLLLLRIHSYSISTFNFEWAGLLSQLNALHILHYTHPSFHRTNYSYIIHKWNNFCLINLLLLLLLLCLWHRINHLFLLHYHYVCEFLANAAFNVQICQKTLILCVFNVEFFFFFFLKFSTLFIFSLIRFVFFLFSNIFIHLQRVRIPLLIVLFIFLFPLLIAILLVAFIFATYKKEKQMEGGMFKHLKNHSIGSNHRKYIGEYYFVR